MIRKTFSVLTGLALLFGGAAKAGGTVNYNFNYNDPDKVRPIKVNLVLAYAESVGGNFGLGPALNAQYMIKNLFTIEGNFRHGLYGDMLLKRSGADKEGMHTKNTDLKGYMHMDGGFAWHFSDRLVDRKITVLLSGVPGYTTSYSMRIPAKARKIYALRGGIDYVSTATAPGAFGASGDAWKIGGKEYDDSVTANYNRFGFYGGIATRRIDRVSVNAGGYGGRRRNRDRQLFLDVLYGKVNIANATMKDGRELIVEPVNPAKNIGWRFGGQWIDNGTYFRLELGQYPGFGKRPDDKQSIPALGVHLGFGLTIFGNEKSLKKIQKEQEKEKARQQQQNTTEPAKAQ